LQPEICAPKCWKEEWIGGENGANQGEDDRQTMSKIGQAEQYVAEYSRLARDRQQWKTFVHEVISDPQQ